MGITSSAFLALPDTFREKERKKPVAVISPTANFAHAIPVSAHLSTGVTFWSYIKQDLLRSRCKPQGQEPRTVPCLPLHNISISASLIGYTYPDCISSGTVWVLVGKIILPFSSGETTKHPNSHS